MNILVFLEHDGTAIRSSSRSALTFAQSVANDTKGNVSGLLLGHNCEVAAQDAATYVPVAVADHADLAYPLSDRWATIIARFVREERIDLLVAASNTTAKDIVARAAGLLGGTMASEVIAYQFQDDRLEFRRPMYAGAVTATVVLLGDPQIVTVRSAAFEPAGRAESSHKIHEIEVSSEEQIGRAHV
jgi:electron transfer flavoprotein alpha subunit